MTITKHAALLLMTLVGLTGLLNAQSSARITAQVPFDFVAYGKAMPAGQCNITVDLNGRPMLSITSGKQHTFAFPVMDLSAASRRETALIFHHYGNNYFLAEIKRSGRASYQLPAGKLERELQARNIPMHEFTLLASAK